MKKQCKRRFSHDFATRLLVALLALLTPLPAWATGGTSAPMESLTAESPTNNAFSFAQLGAEADKQATNHAAQIVATTTGAMINAPLQDLTGNLTSSGLWLRSTAEPQSAAPLRLKASAVGRERQRLTPFAATGAVQVVDGLARWLRPGVVEEFSTSSDGVRQDFVLLERPAGTGALRLLVTVEGGYGTSGNRRGATAIARFGAHVGLLQFASQ